MAMDDSARTNTLGAVNEPPARDTKHKEPHERSMAEERARIRKYVTEVHLRKDELTEEEIERETTEFYRHLYG
jgi:hypothetical protein